MRFLTRRFMFLLTALVLACTSTRADASTISYLDARDTPFYGANFTVVDTAGVAGRGQASMYVIDSYFHLAYYHNVLGGNVDVSTRPSLTHFSGSAGVELPSVLVDLSLDLFWSRRLDEINAVEIGVSPGFYADPAVISLRALMYPIRFNWIRAIDDDLSFILGAHLRTDFDRAILPYFGLYWVPSDRARLQIMLPETRVEFDLVTDWTVYGGLAWRSQDYRVSDVGPIDRSQMTIEDWRLYIGANYRVHDDAYWGLEFGQLFDRSFIYNEALPGMTEGMDASDASYLKLSFIGPF